MFYVCKCLNCDGGKIRNLSVKFAIFQKFDRTKNGNSDQAEEFGAAGWSRLHNAWRNWLIRQLVVVFRMLLILVASVQEAVTNFI